MNQPVSDPLEAILYQCAQATPRPWYPRQYAELIGVHRDTLDPFLERLRLRGLISLTPWEKDLGQGYTLTAEGKRVLYNPHLLARLRDGTLPPAPPPEEMQHNLRAAPGTAYGRGEQIRQAMVSPGPAVVTFTLIGLNILVFLAGLGLASSRGVPVQTYLFDPDNRPVQAIIHTTGALTGHDLLRGEWWRLISSCFVHFGIIHLGMNMYFLYVLGPISEKMWGRWRFLVLYAIAGLGGSSAMACTFLLGQDTLGAGASGALWGIMTAFLVWVFLNRSYLPPQLASTWFRQVGFCLLLNIGITFLIPVLSKAGHFGGGAFGVMAAVLLNYERFTRSPLRWPARLALAMLPVLCVGAVVYASRAEPHVPALREGNDIERLKKEVLPAVETLGNEALKVYGNDTQNLLKQEWQQRDPAAVEKTLAALTEGRAKLKQALDILQQSGPYSSPRGLKISQACQEMLEANVKLFELAERCLRAGEQWTEKDKKALGEQAERADKAVKNLNDVWKEVH
jgi:membrane associated rhomboid family serine protease